MTDPPPLTGRVTPEDEISLWDVLLVLLRRRRLILGSAVVAVVLTVLVTLFAARTWTTEASFRPQGSSSGSELAALASQFGVRVPMGGEEVESPAFYEELVTSRQILASLASGTYEVDGGRQTLVQFLEIDEDTPGLEERAVIEWLREEAISVSTGRETGIVNVDVQTEAPDLSLRLAERLLEEMGRFNLETRQSQAAAERSFIETRVDAVEQELRKAEEQLLDHVQRNRQISSSPELQYERDRLQEEVMSRRQIHTSLIQAYEEARISEVRDTPVLTVIQTPYLPPAPDGRGLLIRMFLGAVLGCVVGIVLAFLADAVSRPLPGSARAELRRDWDQLVSTLPVLGRRRAGRSSEVSP